MPKKSKTTKDGNSGLPASPRKGPSKKSKSAVKQTRPASKAKSPPPTTSPAAGNPTNDEIELRAYFIAERRQRLALPGDSNSDWLEAKRQLLSELGQR